MIQIIGLLKYKLSEKRSVLLFFFLSVCLINGLDVTAQTISATTYPMTASSGVSLNTYTSLGTLITTGSDNTNSALTNIGFDFWFNGARYTQFGVNTNGHLRLGSVITRIHNSNNLADGAQDPKIAAYWDDLTTGNNGYVKYGLNGTAPNRTLVIEWKTNIHVNSTSVTAKAPVVFQAILSESTGKIQFIYGAIATNSFGYSIGFSSSGTTIASVATVSNAVSYGSDPNKTQSTAITAGKSYTFNSLVPVTPTNLTFSNVSTTAITINWLDNASNETAYVLYSSTDNSIFTFNQKVAANSTTINISGLTTNTVYYFKVYAVTEGYLSAPLTGSQTTQNQVIFTSGNTTWTVPSCVTSITVEVWGAGGGGGSSNTTTTNGGSGGGGGAYAKGVHTVVPGSLYYYNVGVKGNGGPANSTIVPTSGGKTWFNATAATNAAPTSKTTGTLSVGGGRGSNNNSVMLTSNAGLASLCFGNVATASGISGLAGTSKGGRSGGAGASPGGGAGGAGSTTTDGTSGTTPGGGGGGGNDSPTNKGGDGAIGQIKITYSTSTPSAAPVINAPICSGSTSVSGTSSEPNGTIIEVFVGGITRGTTTVSLGKWTKSGITALIAGDVITATAVAPSCKTVSVQSTSVTISASPTVATNTSTQTICSSGSATLLGNLPNSGAGVWSIVSGPSTLTSQFSSLTSPTAVFTPAGGLGNYVLRWTISNSPCTASFADATITVVSDSIGGTVIGGGAICSGSSTGVLTLLGYTGSIVRWESSISPFSIWTPIVNTTAIYTYGVLSQDTKFRAVIQKGTCSIVNSTTATVNLGVTTTWDGTSWSNGVPTSSMPAIINGNFTSSTNGGNLNACSLKVSSGAVIISSGNYVSLNGALSVLSGSFTLENNANLIQSTNVSNSGNIIVKRDTAALMRQDYVLWSSPVANQQLLAFSPATLATRFYTYDSSTDVYVAVASPSTTNFTTGKGYLIRVPNNHPSTPTVWGGQFTGVPNNGTIDLSVTNATFNATGNPYPSTISADAFIADNNITEALYFWRKTNNPNNSSYATYTTAGGVANSGDTLGLIPNGTIAVGQGFLVKSTSTVISFTNSIRLANSSAVFLKNTKERNRIWLTLTSDSGSFYQTMVSYMSNATAAIDAKIDGRFLNDTQTAITSLINNEEFTIQGRGLPFDDDDVVTLGFKAKVAENYTITLSNFDGFFAKGQAVYLKDKLTNTIHDLHSGPYSFASNAGTFNNRFEIVYQKYLASQQQSFTENSIVVYKQGQEIVINSGKTILSNVKVYDIRGRLLISKNNINASQIRVYSGISPEILIVKITSDTNAIVTKKVAN